MPKIAANAPPAGTARAPAAESVLAAPVAEAVPLPNPSAPLSVSSASLVSVAVADASPVLVGFAEAAAAFEEELNLYAC
jgi:hypothetical protein